MPEYSAIDRDGREPKIGDKLTSNRGETAFWEGVEGINEFTNSAKVMIRWEGHGCILTKPAALFDLTVKDVRS